MDTAADKHHKQHSRDGGFPRPRIGRAKDQFDNFLRYAPCEFARDRPISHGVSEINDESLCLSHVAEDIAGQDANPKMAACDCDAEESNLESGGPAFH